jgi:quaternary ammonium compound-resistance protein SugE
MNWSILFIAGVFEVVWAVALKYSEGLSRPAPTIATLAAMLASMVLLGLAVRTLPLGTAYAVWTGIGTIGAVVFGIVVFGEPATPTRLLCLALIVAGIAGLKALPH